MKIIWQDCPVLHVNEGPPPPPSSSFSITFEPSKEEEEEEAEEGDPWESFED